MKILITGTSSGIGQSLARFLGAGGHEISGIARRSQDAFQAECASQDIAFRLTQCDIAHWAQLESCAATLAQDWGRLDALICCAGIQGPIQDAMKADPVLWAQSVHTNLTGTYFTLRAMYPLLRQSERRAKVICFSGGGSTGPRINFTPYAAAKAGVVRLVETLAHEWEGQPIDINAIAPGAVNTRMTEEVLSLGPDIAGAREFKSATRQLQQGGTPPEVYCECIQCLLSHRSDGVSGRLISALWDPWKDLDTHAEELKPTDIFTLRRIVPKERGKAWD
jgi:NAD(P)-dependent dehydrogenase (short-subunit alcohol dehydrogenase family)